MADLQPSAPTSIHEADRKLSCIPPPHATGDQRKVSTSSSLHERKVSTATSGLQGLQISLDNILLREARSASVSTGNGPNSPTLHHHHPHVPKKFIHTWRQACDKTKERTKDLIKRWRTLPEGSPTSTPPDGEARGGSWGHSWGWGISGDDPSSGDGMTATDGSMESGEAWWRCRGFPGQPPPPLLPLAQEQRAKLAQLFNTLLDTDSDGLVAPDDFHGLAERLCQFAGWKENGPQACMLREVISGLLEAFLRTLHSPPADDCDSPTAMQNGGKHSEPQSLGLFLGLDDWLGEWCQLLRGARSLSDLPLWLQYFPKVLFAAINRTGNGVISREELRYFYTCFLGFDSRKVDEALNVAFDAMTANGDHNLNCPTYQLVFANFLLGRHPNGPGQYVFGPFGDAGRHIDDTIFPVDYSAMNSLPEDLEEYSPGRRSNRRSRTNISS